MLAEVEALVLLRPASTRRPIVSVDDLADDQASPRTRSTSVTTEATIWSSSSVGTAAEEHALVGRPTALIGAVGEEAEQDRTDEPTDEVDGDDVEAVVELERPS